MNPPKLIKMQVNCMHPYTVYGIETGNIDEQSKYTIEIACTLIPFTVLKLSNPCWSYSFGLIACTLIPFTVLKRSTTLSAHSSGFIACTLIPFTVLKHYARSMMDFTDIKIACTLIPFTVLKLAANCSST